MASKTHTPHLGERIKSARKRSGLSHDKLGAIIGTSRQHLIRLEKGIHKPRPDLLVRIAEATNTRIEDFASQPDEDDGEESDVVGALMLALRRFVRDELRSMA